MIVDFLLKLPAPQITLISRRPKLGMSMSRAARVVRGIGNEGELHAALQGIADTSTRLVDLSSLTLTEQLDLIVETDILIGKSPTLNLVMLCLLKGCLA